MDDIKEQLVISEVEPQIAARAEPEGARTCVCCKVVYESTHQARTCEREHGTSLIGYFRGELCPLCQNAYPTHKADCASKPVYCDECGHITTRCTNGHCQECCIDDEHYPVEDCTACTLLVGGIIKETDTAQEQLPTDEERYDRIPDPFED